MNDNEKPERKLPQDITLADFYAYLPKNEFIFTPVSNVLWKAVSINMRLPPVTLMEADGTVSVDQDGEPIELKPATWLVKNRGVEAMSWDPREPEIVSGRLPASSGWIERPGTHTFNTYRPPQPCHGRAGGAGRWRELLAKLYPDDVDHIAAFCAHCIQRPGVKINHALVIAGPPRIGKDTLFEPLRLGVGAANFAETSPHTIMKAEWNDYLCSVVLRISEARDQGETNRYSFYEKMKTMLAAPPPMHWIQTKYIPNYFAPNCTNVITTTNYGLDGLYLPPDDGRHYVVNTEIRREDFPEGFFDEYWAWQEAGGAANVVAYLRTYDLSRFNAKTPPRQTPAFWVMVGAGMAPEISELDDVIDRLGRLETPPATRDGGVPCGPAALTLTMLRAEATSGANDLHAWLADRKNRRAIPHRLVSCGYAPVRSSSQDGLWIVNGKRQAIYGRRDLTPAQRSAAATALAGRELPANVTPLKQR
jgi:hypothetical protein